MEQALEEADNSLYHTKVEINNCLIINSNKIPS